MTNAFPIALLLKGKKCLVVGGGHVAIRKINHLLEAEARVTVVTKQPLEDSKVINKIEFLYIKEFNESDLSECYLVYAATNDSKVNNTILEICKQKNILCCTVDNNWSNSSFITPAYFQHNNLLVSVSSLGNSCIKSKMIKNSLLRCFTKKSELELTPELLVFGVDTPSSSLEYLKQVYPTSENIENINDKLNELVGVYEYFWLTTCNRIELYLIAPPRASLIEIIENIFNSNNLYQNKYYVKIAKDAFNHLCEVCTGLRSLQFGENHVVSQIKAALCCYQKENCAGSLMGDIINQVLRIHKHIRTTYLGDFESSSIENNCLNYIKKHFNQIQPVNICIIGTGHLGKALISSLLITNFPIKWIYHSQPPTMSLPSNIQLLPWSQITKTIELSNVIITAITTELPLYNTKELNHLNLIHQTHILDLGIPHNILYNPTEDQHNIHYQTIETLNNHFYTTQQYQESYSIAKQYIISQQELYDKAKLHIYRRQSEQQTCYNSDTSSSPRIKENNTHCEF